MNKEEEKRISPKVKRAVTIAAIVFSVVAVLAVVIQITGIFKPENNGIMVYAKGNETVVRIDKIEKTIKDDSASYFKCDAEEGRVFFLVESSYSDNLFDLCFIEKNRSEISDPRIIDIGVSQSYDVVSGKVYYLKKNVGAGAFEGCVCDVKENKIETFSDNVENIYALEGGNVYFTKMHGTNRVLYKYNEAESSEVCRELEKIVCYNDTDNPHVIFEKKSTVNKGMTELYIAYAQGSHEMICDSTYSVMYDDYEPGGNLYYFSSSTESISWSYVIADQYAETDPLVVKPEKNSFLDILGLSSEYNEAMQVYEDKLARDEIRQALNECDLNGDFSVPTFNAFVYNSDGSLLLAEKVASDSVYAVSPFGTPEIVYESTSVLPSDTDIDAFVDLAANSSVADVIEYARGIISESIVSDGMVFSAHSESGNVVHKLDGYDKNTTLFAFSHNGDRLFAFVRDSQGKRLNLFTNTISADYTPSQNICVDTGVSSYRFSDDSLVYLKSDMNTVSGDVFDYNGEESIKLSNSANAFIVENYEDVIILKNHNSETSAQTADYYHCYNGEEILIGSNVLVESFVYNDSGKSAYITADRELFIYDKNSLALVNNGVTDIILLA